MNTQELIEKLNSKLKAEGFKGYDPYDGLNSRLLMNSPFFRFRALRLAWIQFFKRSPLNLRRPALVPKGYNSKGLALIIRGLINLNALRERREYIDQARSIAGIILSQRAPGREYFCAGYNFFWEARAFSVPAFTPNMVVSSFAAQAFIDLYEADGDEKWFDYAVQAGEFILNELVIFESGQELNFGYIPGDRGGVHNVNLMGAALFARLFSLTGEDRYREISLKAVRRSAGFQKKDGSWAYGERSHHRWVDNFHTGFNLLSLKEIKDYLKVDLWDEAIDSGLDYHISHHFLEDMTPKYFDNAVYPVDIHNFAQGIVTFLAFGYPERASKILEKCVDMMWDDDSCYFYYQKRRWHTNRIDYFRWSQAWMFYALCRFHRETGL